MIFTGLPNTLVSFDSAIVFVDRPTKMVKIAPTTTTVTVVCVSRGT